MTDIIGLWTMINPTVVVPVNQLTSISVSPSTISLVFGASQQFTATGQLSNGGTTSVAVNWTCTGGTITSGGLFVAGTSAGTFRVTATSTTDPTIIGSATVTVTSTPAAKTLNSISVSPSSVVMNLSTTQQFAATAHYSDGTTANITTNGTAWTADRGTIGASTGLYTAPSKLSDSMAVSNSSLNRYSDGCDSWPVTWSDDGKLYLLGNDGDGWDGIDVRGMTIASLTGGPTDNLSANGTEVFTKVDVLGTGIVAVGSTLYVWEQDRVTFHKSRVGKSTNHGASWTYPAGTGWDYDTVGLNGPTFIQYGQANAGARDNYVYFTQITSTGFKLGRVPNTQVEVKSAHEFFTGTSSNPTWSSSWGSAVNIALESNVESQLGVNYNPVLGKYFLGLNTNGTGGLSFWEAPEPWGPWTKISTLTSLGGDTEAKFGLTFVNKTGWLSTDGKQWYFLISGLNAWDSLNVLKATITTGSSTALVTATYNGKSGSATVTLTTGTLPSINPSTSFPNRPAGGTRCLEEKWLAMSEYGKTITSTGANDPYGLLLGQRVVFSSSGNDTIGTAGSSTGFPSPSLGERHRFPQGLSEGGGSGLWEHTNGVNPKGYLTWYEAEFFNLEGDGSGGYEGCGDGGFTKLFGYWSISSTTGQPFEAAHIGGIYAYGGTLLANGNKYSDKFNVALNSNFNAGWATHVRIDSNSALQITVGHNMRIEWIFLCGTPDVADGRVICYLTDFTASLGPTKVLDGYTVLRSNVNVNGIIPNGGIFRRHYDMIWGGRGPSSLSRTQYKLQDHFYAEGQRPV